MEVVGYAAVSLRRTFEADADDRVLALGRHQVAKVDRAGRDEADRLSRRARETIHRGNPIVVRAEIGCHEFALLTNATWGGTGNVLTCNDGLPTVEIAVVNRLEEIDCVARASQYIDQGGSRERGHPLPIGRPARRKPQLSEIDGREGFSRGTIQ